MKRKHRTHPPRAARLFAEPADSSEGACTAYIDGASRGNPGPASYAVIIRSPTGEVRDRMKKEIGKNTNNVAEYYALIAALDYAYAHRISKLRVRSDSELLVRQMKGHYRVKSFALRQLHEKARKLAGSLAYFSIEHVPREQNREADALANAALDRTSGTVSREAGASRLGDSEFRLAQDAKRTEVASQESKVEGRRIRARYRDGALHPAEPLDLAEGAEVEITIHPARRD